MAPLLSRTTNTRHMSDFCQRKALSRNHLVRLSSVQENSETRDSALSPGSSSTTMSATNSPNACSSKVDYEMLASQSNVSSETLSLLGHVNLGT